MKELKNVPELRFPGFGGEWRTKKLGSICTKVGSGKTPKGGEKVYSNDGIPFIRSQNVIDNQLRTDSTFIPLKVHREMKGSKVVSNDILLNITGGSIGRSCVVPTELKEGNVNQHVCIIRLKNDNPYFLQPILSSWRGQKLIYQGQTGSGREGLNFESIKVFRIGFPSLPEQTKIANFLTTVDERINLLTQQKDKLEQYKKGVMQKIFSQQLQFKDDDGNEFPEWEEKRLEEVSKNIMYGLNSSAVNFDGVNKYIRITDIHETNNKFCPSPLTSPEGKLDESFRVREGDLLFARTGASVGKSYLYNKNDGKLYFAGFLIRFSINKAVPLFVFYCTLTHEYWKWVNVMSMRSGQPGINAQEYKSFKIKFPCIEEQQKIASFLSSIDKKIELVNQQIEQTKTWKKGLLQKMFV
ncbi:MAG: restriction endonuclease subunit S [Prolixibacteraceae bacterium]|nr:restriction endonuclease subunit S [Prolixibacteraceae bacterium]